MPPFTPGRRAPSEPTITPPFPLLRNMGVEIITAIDSPSLQTALTTAFNNGGEKRLVALFHVADWEVMLVWSR